MAFLARMKKELEMLEAPPPGVAAWLRDPSDMLILDAQVTGMEGPYEGGVFRLEVHLSPKYPFEPPNVRFITPIYHPNIDDAGRICLDLLKMPPKGEWKPSLNLTTILTSVQQLMGEPNCSDPLMHDITEQYLHRREEFLAMARSWTDKYAAPGTAASGPAEVPGEPPGPPPPALPTPTHAAAAPPPKPDGLPARHPKRPRLG
eukprot:EG_transcript_19192